MLDANNVSLTMFWWIRILRRSDEGGNIYDCNLGFGFIFYLFILKNMGVCFCTCIVFIFGLHYWCLMIYLLIYLFLDSEHCWTMACVWGEGRGTCSYQRVFFFLYFYNVFLLLYFLFWDLMLFCFLCIIGSY